MKTMAPMPNKSVLITGRSGFIATALKKHLEARGYSDVRLLDLRGDSWLSEPLPKCDVIVHTAALVHKSEKKIDYSEYEKANVEKTVRLAEKAKAEGVGQFVFISSLAAVLNTPESLSADVKIGRDFFTEPKTKYGRSKLEAERILEKLGCESFKVARVRPPIVYGRGCKGNYLFLRKLALKLPAFPDVPNKKSMIYVGNLCELVRLIIENSSEGVFLPDNAELVSTGEFARIIAECNGKTLRLSKLLGLAVRAASFMTIVRKAFGSVCYDHSENAYFGGKYRIFGLEESIAETEKK